MSSLLLAASPVLAASPKPPPCPPGRYLLPAGERVLDGVPAPEIDAIVLTAEGTVRIASGCPEQALRQKVRKRGTRVKAKWPAGACDGLAGRPRLSATIDVDCAAMQGKLTARKFRREFGARRSACGDGVADREGGEACPSLEGPPEAPAVEGTVDFDDGAAPAPEEVDVDAAGATLVRTQLEVGFAPAAMVAEVNAALASVSGTIVSMLDGVPILGIRIPDPGSVAVLDQVVSALAADPAVRFVRRAYMPAPKVVPVLTPPLDVVHDFQYVEHHLAVGAGAAWNVRAALPAVSARPYVVVADFFGNGVPDDAFDALVERDFDFRIGAPSAHGYHVLGIIAARFDGLATPTRRRGRDVATGVFPGTVPVRVVDGQPAHRLENQALIQVVGQVAASRRVVVNTSNGFLCTSAALEQALCANPDHFLEEGRTWIEKVRERQLEGAFLHVASAGNLDFSGADPNLKTDSEFTTAALLSAAELGMPPLTNTLVVDNRVTYRAMRPYRPGCVYEGSRRGGQLSAMGTEIWSLLDARGDTAAGFKTGTSMAAPQVAGIAAYLWALAPQLTPQELRGLLLQTARPVPECSGPGDGVPVIDAYAAVLAADRGGSLAVRRALFDVADGSGQPGTNGRFDAHDLGVVLNEITSGNGANDYSRFDLNGDGYTGGSERRRFDLDANAPPAYARLTRTIAGSSREFDENALTDLDVLCYYAFSPLFEVVSGLPSAADLLGDQCTCPPAGSRIGGPRGVGQCEVTSIAIVSRDSSVYAQVSVASACQPSNDFQQKRSTTLDPFSDGVGTSLTCTAPNGLGGTTTDVESTSASQSSSVTLDAASGVLEVAGTFSASASADISCDPPHPSCPNRGSQGTGSGSGIAVEFEVLGSAQAYLVAHGSNAPANCGAQLQDRQTSAITYLSDGQSGTLEPGRYVVGTSCGAGSPYSGDPQMHSATFTFTVGG